jgi:hypothetical protein
LAAAKPGNGFDTGKIHKDSSWQKLTVVLCVDYKGRMRDKPDK